MAMKNETTKEEGKTENFLMQVSFRKVLGATGLGRSIYEWKVYNSPKGNRARGVNKKSKSFKSASPK